MYSFQQQFIIKMVYIILHYYVILYFCYSYSYFHNLILLHYAHKCPAINYEKLADKCAISLILINCLYYRPCGTFLLIIVHSVCAIYLFATKWRANMYKVSEGKENIV